MRKLAEALEAIGDLRERMGQYPDAKDAYTRARRLRAGDVVALSRLCLKQATVADRGGSYPQALSWLQRGIKLVADSDDPAAAKQRARLIAEYGVVRQAQGRRLDAVRWLNEAIDAAQRADEREALAQAYFVLDWALVDLGRSDEAVFSQRALELYDELGSSGRRPPSTTTSGRSPTTRAAGTLRSTCSRSPGSFVSGWGTRSMRRSAPSTLPRSGAIRDTSRRRAGDSRRPAEYGGRPTTASAWRLLPMHSALWPAGQEISPSPPELFDSARATFAALVSEHDLVDTDARIGESLTLQGCAQDALDTASRCLEQTAADGGSAHDPMLHRIRGYAWLQLGDVQAGRNELGRSLAVARARNARYDVALALNAIARIGERTGTPDPKAREEADRLFRTLKVVRIAEVPLHSTLAANRV